MVDPATLVAVTQRVVGAGAAMVQSRWQAIMEAAKRGDADEVAMLVKRLQDELGDWASALEERVASLPQDGADERAEPYSGSWWQHRVDEVARRLQVSGEAAFAPWAAAYIDALSLGDGATLDALADMAPEISPDAVDASAIGPALAAGQHEEALARVHELLRRAVSRPAQLLDHDRRAALLVLAGRLCLELGRVDAAGLRFRTADEIDPSQPRIAVSIGQYHASRGDQEEALAQYREALDLAEGKAVESAEPCLALGAAAAQDEAWEEAEEWYGRAAQAVMSTRDPDGALGALLVPADGNAFLRLAQQLAERDREAARRAVEHALGMQITLRGGQAYRHALDLKARLTPDPEAAAASRGEAGRMFSAAGEYDQAIALLEESIEAGYRDALAYWELADARRMKAIKIQELASPERRSLLDESLRAWAEGCSVRPPVASESWVHIAAALANYALADSDEANELQLRWRGIDLLERALRLDPENPIAWSWVASLLRQQGADISALAASEHALAVDDSPMALFERAAALINAGLPEEARPFIERLRGATQDWSTDWLLSLVDVQLGEAAAARRRLDDLLEIQKDPDVGGEARALRAYCARRLNDRKAALPDYEILRDGEGVPPERRVTAEYQLDQFEKALALLAPRRPYREYELRMGLTIGLCHLAVGDVETARVQFQTKLSRLITRVDVEDSRFELEELSRRLEGRPETAHQREVIKELLEQVNSLEPQEPHSLMAEDELRRLLDAPNLAPGAPVAIHASLSRLALRAPRWEEAALEHQEWHRMDDASPESLLGLEQSVTGMLNAARDRLAAGDSIPAAEQLDHAERLLTTLDIRIPRAVGVLHALRVTLAVSRHDPQASVSALQRAIEAFGADAADPAEALVDVLRGSWSGHDQMWDLLGALTDAADEPSEASEDLRRARALLVEELRNTYQLALGDMPTTLDHRPRVQLSTTLVPEDTSPTGPLFAQHVPAMHERILDELGVVVPGTQFESDFDAPSGVYAITLQDFTVQMGEIPEGASYYCADPASVLGVVGEEAIVREQLHPVTGLPGAWIMDSAIPSLDASQVWSDPMVFVVAELEAVLRRNAADFVGLDYLDGLIEDWGLADRAAPIVEEVLASASARVRFASVAREAIAEGVPLLDGPAILAGYRRGVSADGGPESCPLREIRLAMRDQLPGRDENTFRILLPAALEQELVQALAPANGDHPVTLSPVRVFAMVAEIRRLLEAGPPRSALVTTSPEARPLLRRLIRGEFPDLVVLCTEELDEDTPVHPPTTGEGGLADPSIPEEASSGV